MPINCPICLDDIARDDEIWACYRCDVLVHLRCMPPRDEGAIQTTNGCPGCRFTEEQAIKEAEEPTIPPLGIWCSICWKWVKWSDRVIKCQAPDELCMGHAHAWCFGGRCGACLLSTRKALRERRHRKLELFKTKM